MSESAALVGTVAVLVGIAAVLAYSPLRAARHPHPTAMITALSLLTLIALVGLGTATGEAASTFGTLAATGMGALAGAVTSQFQNKPPQQEDKDDRPGP